MATEIAELDAAYNDACQRLRALESATTQHLWKKEIARLDRLHRKAVIAFGQRSRALRLAAQAELDIVAVLKQLGKIRRVKV